MSDKFFLDTNILVYSFDQTVPKKCKRARELVQNALETGKGIISFQVVQEFINFALKLVKHPMTTAQANQYYLKVLKPLCRIQSSAPLYINALSVKNKANFTWYDSIIIASALEAECSTLYSEDMQHGRKIQRTTITNPFENV